MSTLVRLTLAALLVCCIGCAGGDVVQVTTVSGKEMHQVLEADTLQQLEKIKKSAQTDTDPYDLSQVIQKTPNYSVEEYLSLHGQDPKTALGDYRVGGMDVLDITVYEEPDLSRKGVRVSSDGFISFPLIGRLQVGDRTPPEIETRIAEALAQGQFLREAHVSVVVTEYKSRQFMVLGAVRSPGTYPLTAHERVLDAISRAGGLDTEKGGNQGMVIREESSGTPREKKVVIRIDMAGLMKGGNQYDNLPLADKDLLYIPTAQQFYIIGQVEKPGSYPYLENEITIVEAISKAGGFTRIASPNRTRIIRMEGGVEKIIEVRVNEITSSGKKTQDVVVKPGDVIVIPESIF